MQASEVELPAAPYGVDPTIKDKAREVIAAEHELAAYGLRGALADMQSAEPGAWMRGYRKLSGRLLELEKQSERRGARRIAPVVGTIGAAAGALVGLIVGGAL